MQRGAEARDSASDLLESLDRHSTAYTLTKSELNYQLRYIALVLTENNNASRACEIMKSLCEQNPDLAELHREYAFALSSNHQLDEAEAELSEALQIQPIHANCHAQLARIYCLTGRVNAGYNSYSKAATIDPHNPNYLQKLIYWNNFSESATQQSNYQLTRLWAAKAHLGNRVGTNTWRIPTPDRQLKIAFVSSGFTQSSISYFLKPLLKDLNRQEFHVTTYHNAKSVNNMSEAIRIQSDSWRNTVNETDHDLCSKITSDQIDILIDLDGHNSGNRLSIFSNHLAPIQVSWLGYPSTTGLRSIDFRISDRIADPIGKSDPFYTEELIRLANGCLCYAPPENAAVIEPSTNNGCVRFGSFNGLEKISELTLDCWAAAMHAVPDSSLSLKHQQLTNQRASRRLIDKLGERGIDHARLVIDSSNLAGQFLSEYNNIDIALDTSPYNGVTTSLEALWMGVPLISLKGQTHASRISASILERLDLGQFATTSVFEFAKRARELSEQVESRQELRNTLRNKVRQSPLVDSKRFSQEFAQALRDKWHLWCQQHGTERDLTPTTQTSIARTMHE